MALSLAPLAAASFAPTVAVTAPTVSRASTVKMETMADLKVLAEKLNPAVGFWDPLKLSEQSFWDSTNEETIGWLRHAEIKHGRIAMAGFVGYIVHANGIRWPWALSYSLPDYSSFEGLSAPAVFHSIPEAAKVQIILAVGFLEMWSEMRLIPGEMHYMKGGKPGYVPPFDATPDKLMHPMPFNLYDPFKYSAKKTPAEKERGLLVELNNGRLAMLGIMAFLSEGKVPGSVPFLKGVVPPMEYDIMGPLYLDFSNGVAF